MSVSACTASRKDHQPLSTGVHQGSPQQLVTQPTASEACRGGEGQGGAGEGQGRGGARGGEGQGRGKGGAGEERGGAGEGQGRGRGGEGRGRGGAGEGQGRGRGGAREGRKKWKRVSLFSASFSISLCCQPLLLSEEGTAGLPNREYILERRAAGVAGSRSSVLTRVT